MSGTDRRLAERIDLKIPVRVRIAKAGAPGHLTESVNISSRGICFPTTLPLHKGTPVELVFEMPEQVTHKPASEWRCTGHVVYTRPNDRRRGEIRVGVGFDCYEILPAAQRAPNEASTGSL